MAIVRPIVRKIVRPIVNPVNSRYCSWDAYWAAQDLNLWAKDRSGLNLVDDFGDDISILPAYLYKSAGTEYAYNVNSGLDIGSVNDFTFCGWFKSEAPDKSVTNYIGGKLYAAAPWAYRYGFYASLTTGYIKAIVSSSVTNLTASSDIDFTTAGWVFLRMDVNQTTKVFRFFINGVQIGEDQAWTGSFAASSRNFVIGARDNNTLPGKISVSDTYIFPFLLTPTQEATLISRGYVAGATAHWPLMGAAEFLPDVSGNGYNLTGNGLDSILNTKFSADGSLYGLNKGFSLYQNGWNEIYVGNKFDGTEITPIGIPAGYKKTSEGNHPLNISKHNLANSVLAMTGASWDRSNATIFSEEARRVDTFYDDTSATTKKYWHVSECNNLKFQSWANAGYKGISAFKVSDYSYKSRKTLNEIMSFDTEQTNGKYSTLMDYCNDFVYDGIFENDNIYWKYEANSVLATRDSKQLKWEDAATDKLYLSIDGGLTYPHSINSPVNGAIPQFANIFGNGNILIGFITSLFLSTDNLSTINLITAKDIDGNDYSPTNHAFNALFRTNPVIHGAIEMCIWGCYRTLVADDDQDVNIWYTIDNGVTVKSCYQAGITDPPNLNARHFHAVAYNVDNDKFYVSTGDNAGAVINECNILLGDYDWDLDTWDWSKLYGDVAGEKDYLWTEMGFNNSDIIAITDDNTNPQRGLFSCAIADLGDSGNFVSKFNAINESGNMIFDYPNIIAKLNSLIATKDRNGIITSNNGEDNLVGTKLYGLPANITGCHIPFNKNSDNYYLFHIRIDGDHDYDQYQNGVIWVKLK